MSLSKRKCWYSNNCLYFIKRAVPLEALELITIFSNSERGFCDVITLRPKLVQPKRSKVAILTNFCEQCVFCKFSQILLNSCNVLL